jgi:ATP-dependent DNA helicase RecG
VRGTISELVDIAEKYFINNTRWKAVIDGSSMQRKEIPEVPLAAIREALNNSYTHKDYRVPQNNEVAIYSNRIEIYNPGTFPVGLSPEDFLDGSGKSIHRNSLLAQTMYYSRDIESFGTGLKRIADTCAEAGVEYKFISEKLGFAVVFYRPELHVADKVADKLPINVADKLTAAEAEFMRLLEPHFKDHEWITNAKARKITNREEGSVKRFLRNLAAKGVFEIRGENKSRQYRLKNERD